MILYEITCRPLVRKKRADGMCECYESRATWDAARKYPVTVSITRYYAPVSKTDKGTLNVQLSRRDQASVQNASFSMTGAEWLYTVSQMETAVNTFTMLHIKDGWRAADEADKAGRASYSASAESTPAPESENEAPVDNGFMPAPEEAPFNDADEFEMFN